MAGAGPVTSRLRRITHPGPVAKDRNVTLPCHAAPVSLTLRAGQSLATAVPRAFAQAGFDAGYLRIDSAVFAPLAFVTPAPAPDDTHAAWYSDRHERRSPTLARHGGVHLGQRDGLPFLHCHVVWDSASDRPDAGHLLCNDSVLAQDCTVTGWGITGAGLAAHPDPETGFTLFRPEAAKAANQANAYLITLRPNQDISKTLTGFARLHRITSAQVAGIGSLVGTAFADGRQIDSFATEMLILSGQIAGDTTILDIAAVGFDGRAQTGILAQGANAVCVTAEVLLICDTEPVTA